MLDTILITLLIVAICIVLLGVKVFFVKGGRFPNGHVSGNKAMRDRGIGCAQSQDREAQRKSRFSIDELEKALNFSMKKKKKTIFINYEEIKLPHERSGSSRTDRFICSMCRQY